MAKKPTPMRLEEALINKIKAFGKEDHRTLTGMVEFILYEYAKKRSNFNT